MIQQEWAVLHTGLWLSREAAAAGSGAQALPAMLNHSCVPWQQGGTGVALGWHCRGVTVVLV